MRRAEAEIHTPIFDRSTNPIRLTAAGTYYIDAVKRILDIRQELESYFDALAGECRGSVRVGAASFFCAHVLPDIAEEFQRQYPAWRASMLEVNAPDLYPCLQSGTIDLSLSVEAADPRLFHSTVWHEEQILLAVPAAFSVNRGLETFQLTAAQVREGVHLQGDFPAVDLSRFAQEPCPGAGPAAHRLLHRPGRQGVHLPAGRHGPVPGGQRAAGLLQAGGPCRPPAGDAGLAEVGGTVPPRQGPAGVSHRNTAAGVEGQALMEKVRYR